jgi:hypothetical protein
LPVSFVTALALGIAFLVAAPLLAHRLRRLRADERPFAAARLVPAAQPRARRRARLEDRALFGVRALAIIALALLGASPLLRCTRLSLARTSGASIAVALVIDDSMSMRAHASPSPTRFARAKEAALELLAGTRDGDSIAVVLAGAPPRVALAPTTDIGAASALVLSLPPSDRATDLDGALRIAETLLGSLPQVDKRIVVLSDLADGQPDAPALGDAVHLPVWTPLTDIAHDAPDCAVISADDLGGRVRVRLACGKEASAAGRRIEVRQGDRVLGSTTCAASVDGSAAGGTSQTRTVDGSAAGGTSQTRTVDGSAAGGTSQTRTVDVDLSAKDTAIGERTAYLLGGDAIASDDAAPVLVASTGAIGVVAEAADETTVTGGPPVVEQALTALRTDLVVRPVPAVPDQASDFSGLLGLVVDDPPGLTPEQRRALGAYLDGGGVVLLALGPRAAAAPLGATLEPILLHATSWVPTSSTSEPLRGVGSQASLKSEPLRGVAANAPTDFLGEATRSLVDIGAARRTVLAPEDVTQLDDLVPWSDGAPLVARRSQRAGAGEVYVTTLPFSLDASDFALRPAFVALLDAFVTATRAHAAPRRTDVGATWMLPASATSATGPSVLGALSAPIDLVREGGRTKLVPPLVGAYHIHVDDRDDLHVAMPVAKEVDLRPRRIAPRADAARLGATEAQVDVSAYVAIVLLALLLAEIALRVRARATMGAKTETLA